MPRPARRSSRTKTYKVKHEKKCYTTKTPPQIVCKPKINTGEHIFEDCGNLNPNDADEDNDFLDIDLNIGEYGVGSESNSDVVYGSSEYKIDPFDFDIVDIRTFIKTCESFEPFHLKYVVIPETNKLYVYDSNKFNVDVVGLDKQIKEMKNFENEHTPK